jgi:hypothetical protein
MGRGMGPRTAVARRAAARLYTRTPYTSYAKCFTPAFTTAPFTPYTGLRSASLQSSSPPCPAHPTHAWPGKTAEALRGLMGGRGGRGGREGGEGRGGGPPAPAAWHGRDRDSGGHHSAPVAPDDGAIFLLLRPFPISSKTQTPKPFP